MPTTVRKSHWQPANAPASVVVRRGCAALSAIHSSSGRRSQAIATVESILTNHSTDSGQCGLDCRVLTNDERDSALRKLRRGQIEGMGLRFAIETSAARGPIAPADVANNPYDFMAAAVELEHSADGIRVLAQSRRTRPSLTIATSGEPG